MKKILLILSICFLSLSYVQAQDAPKDNTITIWGESAIQLSPNEIIVNITFAEYWTDQEENNKVGIADIEKRILQALKTAAVKDKNITHSAVRLTREYDRQRRRYLKRSLSKSVNICVYTADEIAKVIAALENANLLEQAVTAFNIAELRHTDKAKYEAQAKVEAIQNAKAKGELIVSTLGKTLGEIVTIEEIHSTHRPEAPGSFYSTSNSGGASSNSGISPIIINYKLEAVFEIK